MANFNIAGNQYPKVMIEGPSGFVADVDSTGHLLVSGSGGGGATGPTGPTGATGTGVTGPTGPGTLTSGATGQVAYYTAATTLSGSTGATYDGISKMTLGGTGASGVLALGGTTSGTATLTAPAVAGTATNAISISNSTSLPSGTVRDWNGDTGLSRDSAGVVDVGTGAAGSKAGSMNLTALTMTGALSNSLAGAASAAAVSVTGAPFTGGSGTTTFPLVYFNSGAAPTTFSTSGTVLGINSPSGFSGNFMDFHSNGGTSLVSISSAGALTLPNASISAAGTLTAAGGATLTYLNRSRISSPSDGVLLVSNNAQTSFTRLDLGLATSSGPAFGVSGTTITTQLGDGTSGGIFAVSGTTNLGSSAQTAFNSSGLLTKYNNISTVSGGQPAEYATVDLTAQGAAIAATTLYAVPAAGAGVYRINWVASVTTVDGAASVLGGATGLQILYTDADDSVVKTSPRTVTAGVDTDATNTTATALSGCIVVSAKASTNIQYQMGYTSTTPGQMKFNLHLKLEAL